MTRRQYQSLIALKDAGLSTRICWSVINLVSDQNRVLESSMNRRAQVHLRKAFEEVWVFLYVKQAVHASTLRERSRPDNRMGTSSLTASPMACSLRSSVTATAADFPSIRQDRQVRVGKAISQPGIVRTWLVTAAVEVHPTGIMPSWQSRLSLCLKWLGGRVEDELRTGFGGFSPFLI